MKKYKWVTYEIATNESIDIGEDTIWLAWHKRSSTIEPLVAYSGYFRTAGGIPLIWKEWLYAGPINVNELVDFDL